MRVDKRSNGRTLALVLVAAMVIGAAVPATAAGSPHDPRSVTHVDDCTTIDDSGVYVLDGNVTTTDADRCFQVTADDVTLVGFGHTVAADNATGAAVVADGVSGLRVTGLVAEGWWNGVKLVDATDSTVVDVTVRDAGGDGLRFEGVESTTVRDSTVSGAAGHGVVVADGEDVTVRGSTLSDNAGNGLTVRGSLGTVVEANTVASNGGTGVRVESVPAPADAGASADDAGDVPAYLLPMMGSGGTASLAGLFGGPAGTAEPADDGPPLVVSDNEIADNRYEGLFVYRANGSVVENNTVSGAKDGVHLVNLTDATLSGNDVTASSDDGLALSHVSGTNVTGNRFVDNGDDGVYVFGSNNTVANNTLSENVDDGVDVQSGDHNRVESNDATTNGDDGVYIRGAADTAVVENTLSENGDDGVDVRGATGTLVRGNTICDSGQYDVQIRSGATGTERTDNGC